MSASSDSLITASYMLCVSVMSMTLQNGGGSMAVFPLTIVTSAPLSIAALASAYPILPLEWFEMNLTGSTDSLVGPAVTRTFFPARSFSKAISLIT